MRDTLRDKAADFQPRVAEYVQEHEISPANVYIAHEKGVWTGSVPLRI
jgi:hypothetical protein